MKGRHKMKKWVVYNKMTKKAREFTKLSSATKYMDIVDNEYGGYITTIEKGGKKC